MKPPPALLLSFFMINYAYGQTDTSTTKAESDIKLLRSFIGKWQMIDSSFRNDQADSLYKPGSYIMEIRETQYGIEFVTRNIFFYSGNMHSNILTEYFVADKRVNGLLYFAFDKSSPKDVTTATGKAFFNTDELIIIGHYPDRPGVTGYEHRFKKNKENYIHHTGVFYDNEGKPHHWYFNLVKI
jgi:hypothetical protein